MTTEANTSAQTKVERIRERKRLWTRAWRLRNIDRLREEARRWQASHREEYLAAQRKYYAAHAAQIQARRRAARRRLSQSANLAEWLLAPGAAIYFGDSFELKFAILARLAAGTGSLAEIGRKFNVTRGAVGNHARRARQAFGIESSKPGRLQVDCPPLA